MCITGEEKNTRGERNDQSYHLSHKMKDVLRKPQLPKPDELNCLLDNQLSVHDFFDDTA